MSNSANRIMIHVVLIPVDAGAQAQPFLPSTYYYFLFRHELNAIIVATRNYVISLADLKNNSPPHQKVISNQIYDCN